MEKKIHGKFLYIFLCEIILFELLLKISITTFIYRYRDLYFTCKGLMEPTIYY